MTLAADTDDRWYEIANVGEIPSPALAFYPERIEENIRRMIRIAGGAGRLRPHVKTHKTAEIVRLQLKHGIGKFKCSTIAEAEMTAAAGAPDVLLAMQPVGPAIARFFALKREFPGTSFGAIVDSEDVIEQVARAAGQLRDGRLPVAGRELGHEPDGHCARRRGGAPLPAHPRDAGAERRRPARLRRAHSRIRRGRAREPVRRRVCAGRGDDRRDQASRRCPFLPWWRAVRRRFPFMRSGPAWN